MSDSTSTLRVPVLNKDSQIQLTIGTAPVQDLQHVLGTLLEGRDTTNLTQKLNDKVQLEPWEQSVVFLSGFIQHIYQSAEKQGHVYYKEMSANDILGS